MAGKFLADKASPRASSIRFAIIQYPRHSVQSPPKFSIATFLPYLLLGSSFFDHQNAR